MVLGELLRQLEPGGVVGAEHPAHGARLGEHAEVAVHAALHRGRSVRTMSLVVTGRPGPTSSRRVAAGRRVALAGPAQPARHQLVEVVLHRSSIRLLGIEMRIVLVIYCAMPLRGDRLRCRPRGCGGVRLHACSSASTGSAVAPRHPFTLWRPRASGVRSPAARRHSRRRADVINDPNADPHDYESTSADARAVATADDVIINGAGYDPWADRLVKANAVPWTWRGAVADLVGMHVGDNPHLWYNPMFVDQAADRITADYQRLDRRPARTSRAPDGVREALRPYHDLIASSAASTPRRRWERPRPSSSTWRPPSGWTSCPRRNSCRPWPRATTRRPRASPSSSSSWPPAP